MNSLAGPAGNAVTQVALGMDANSPLLQGASGHRAGNNTGDTVNARG